ncbi:MAG TPA: hypothetical protein VIJ77_03450 [Candidatus Tumulicola sp.]
MDTPAVAPTPSWLNSFDPTNPASATALIGNVTDPINRTTPSGFDVLKPVPIGVPAGPSTYQQAIDAFKVTADSFLIQSAINGYQPLGAQAAFGSPEAAFQGLGNTIAVLKNAALSGHYGSLNTLA